MRLWRKGLALMICLGLLPVLFGCANETDTTEPDVTQTQPLTVAQKYEKARAAVDAAQNRILVYTATQTREVGGSSYTRTTKGKASFSNVGQDSMVAVVEENLQYGTYESSYAETYCGGKAYVQLAETSFAAELTSAAFVARQLPAALLSSSCYEEITEAIDDGMTRIYFRKSMATESWALPQANAQLISAEGEALLDETGALVQTIYRGEYLVGQTKYLYDVTVQVTVPKSLDLGAIHTEHFENLPVLTDIRAPKLLLGAVGDIFSMQTMTGSAVESIYSEAMSVSYVQKSNYALSGADEKLTAKAAYEITLTDYRGEATVTTQVDTYENGAFTSSVNAAEPVAKPGVTAKQMHQYMEDAVLSAVLAPKYLHNAWIEESDTHYRLVMQGNANFVADLMVGIGSFLNADLDKQAESAQTTASDGYLSIEKETGLPVVMELKLVRQHTMQSVPYQLTYQLEQQINLLESE